MQIVGIKTQKKPPFKWERTKQTNCIIKNLYWIPRKIIGTVFTTLIFTNGDFAGRKKDFFTKPLIVRE